MPIVANRMTASERAQLAAGELWHYSKATHRQIVQARLSGKQDEPNALIRLVAPTGYQMDFWKFLRDSMVWDIRALNGDDFGSYLYFFMGEPGTWTRQVNVQKAPLTIRIRGADVLSRVPEDRLFYRMIDKVVVMRGHYEGPAILAPPP